METKTEKQNNPVTGKALDLTPIKGTKDFSGSEQILRNKIAGTLKKVFELYGFQPLETPILNYSEVLASKYAGGAEILKETYNFQDQGKRD